MENNDTITITVAEYEHLMSEQRVLNVLRRCGIDNWEYYDDALDMLDGEDD